MIEFKSYQPLGYIKDTYHRRLSERESKLEDYIALNSENYFEVGKTYKVPCAILGVKWFYKGSNIEFREETDLDQDIEFKTLILPIYELLHDDRESGQLDKHYHVDYRWDYDYGHWNSRIEESEVRDIIYLDLEYKTQFDVHSTRVSFVKEIMKTKKKTCLHNGKLVCPHKGYDLTNIKPVNGIITCPLHSLHFDALSFNLIEHE